jgi:hypothetical protein
MLRFPHASVEKSIFVLFKAAPCQFCPAENARSGALLRPRPLIQLRGGCAVLQWLRRAVNQRSCEGGCSQQQQDLLKNSTKK